MTGASRGIGKGCALALAGAGFDVAFSARTVREGEGRESFAPERSVVGSLESTAAGIEATGRRALPLTMDQRDRAQVGAAAQMVLERWGRVDVLVINAQHTEIDHTHSLLDVSMHTIATEIEANVVANLALAKMLLPGMVERGSGTVIYITSGAGYKNPVAGWGKGGWSASYAFAKASIHRLAGFIAMELGPRGIQAFNITPGFVVTERVQAMPEASALSFTGGAPPSVPGAVVAWFATSPEAASMNGETIEAQAFALERGLHPDWRAPVVDGDEGGDPPTS